MNTKQVLVAIVAVVCIWRGIWLLLDVYLVPDAPEISAIISIAVGIGLILLLGKKFHFLL